MILALGPLLFAVIVVFARSLGIDSVVSRIGASTFAAVVLAYVLFVRPPNAT